MNRHELRPQQWADLDLMVITDYRGINPGKHISVNDYYTDVKPNVAMRDKEAGCKQRIADTHYAGGCMGRYIDVFDWAHPNLEFFPESIVTPVSPCFHSDCARCHLREIYETPDIDSLTAMVLEELVGRLKEDPEKEHTKQLDLIRIYDMRARDEQ